MDAFPARIMLEYILTRSSCPAKTCRCVAFKAGYFPVSLSFSVLRSYSCLSRKSIFIFLT
uniref:Uncharacterized protein n=1 Tax=Anguilla anguilla TaxID=7936 RepID=A0A0E9UZL1_ANGAN